MREIDPVLRFDLQLFGEGDDGFSLSFTDDEPNDEDLNGGNESLDDLAARLAAENGYDPTLNPDGTPRTTAAPAVDPALTTQFADLQRKYDEQAAALAEMQRKAALFDTSPPPTAPVAQPGTTLSPDQLKAKLTADFLADPGGSLMRIFETIDSVASQRAAEATRGTARNAATLLIESFKTRQSAVDPDFARVASEFDAIVNETKLADQLAGMTSEQAASTLGFMYDNAYGRVARKARSAGSRAATPPAYVNGAARASTGGRPATPSTLGGKRLTDEQREVMDYIKTAGIKDPQRIAAMLLEAD